MTGAGAFRRSIQLNGYSCGARSVFMIARHYGIRCTYREVVTQLQLTKEGTRVKRILQFFQQHTLRVYRSSKMTLKELEKHLQQQAIILVHVDGDHFAVVYGMDDHFVYMADPSIIRLFGRRITRERFKQRWTNWGVVVKR